MIENKPDDYIVIRIKAVHVKKGLFGMRDREQLGAISYIANTHKEAFIMFKRIDRMIKKYGKSLKEIKI